MMTRLSNCIVYRIFSARAIQIDLNQFLYIGHISGRFPPLLIVFIAQNLMVAAIR